MAPKQSPRSSSTTGTTARSGGRKATATKASAKKAPARKTAAKKAPAKRSRAGAATVAKEAPAKAAAATRGAAARGAGAVAKASAPATRAAKAVRRTTSGATRSPGRAGPQRDAISLLTDDHRSIEELFARFEQTTDGARKRRHDLVRRISEALSVHASIEEEIFYPAARGAVSDVDDVLEALEEHHLVKMTLAELQAMDPGHERYGAKVTVLIENVRHHVEEEEGEMFPAVRKELGTERLREIGAALEAAKRTAPTRPHPEAPDTPPGNVVAQVLTAPLDIAANLTDAAAQRVRDIVS
jgi:hemerythrin superfamily protein